MKEFHVYKDIRQRTNGEIYLGVVGPVRTGKSTFIRRFMEHMVLVRMEDGPQKQRTRDELPQAGSGRMIMTTEPKFIPTEAASVSLEDGTSVKIRMIDCVGFMAEGAVGEKQEEAERLVRTPWFDHEIPFSQAAEIGTQKVIEEHSTLGIVVTTDGTIGELSREAYLAPEEKTVNELKKLKKPFVVLLNSREPLEERAQVLAKQLKEKYQVSVLPMNCEKLGSSDILRLLEELLMEFPIHEIFFQIPDWMKVLPMSHPLKQKVIRLAKTILNDVSCMKDAERMGRTELPEEMKCLQTEKLSLDSGQITYSMTMKPEVYFRVLTECVGMPITSEEQLLQTLKAYAQIRDQYSKVRSAMESVEQKGYGVVTPDRGQILLDEPQVMRHGNRYGVKMKATAPSVHMIRSMVETEIAPIVGSEQQAQDLIEYIKKNATERDGGIWETNIFGKSIEQIVDDGISAKINQMTDDCQQKLQDAMEKIINDSNGGMICIII
ncbi:MAG: stage IV sporulation protein A [Lachnospiraceae bacterium]|nr:stage IV sporulation protein A [Lachnospiraceae bacterium]